VKQRKNIGGVLNKQSRVKKGWTPNMLLDDGGESYRFNAQRI